MSAHIFFWDGLEIRQLRRMFERHMEHADVVGLIELLVRIFPPEKVLPDPDLFKSQPGTAVKDVVKLLLGLPLAHDYTLLEVANAFYPDLNAEGRPFQYRLPFGFHTDLADQIPFERAYEIWRDHILLTKVVNVGGGQTRRRKCFRQEILDGIERAVLTRLNALEHVVRKLREHHRDRLILRKSGFSAAPSVQSRIPERSRRLIAFERLDVACNEMKNRQDRALPVEEREARFISIRGLLLARGPESDQMIAEIRANRPRYAARPLLAFTFAPTRAMPGFGSGNFCLPCPTKSPTSISTSPGASTWACRSTKRKISTTRKRAKNSVILGVAPETCPPASETLNPSQRPTKQAAGDDSISLGVLALLRIVERSLLPAPWPAPLKELLKVELVRLDPTQTPPVVGTCPKRTATLPAGTGRGVAQSGSPDDPRPAFPGFRRRAHRAGPPGRRWRPPSAAQEAKLMARPRAQRPERNPPTDCSMLRPLYRPSSTRRIRLNGQVPPHPDHFCATTSRSVRYNLD